MKYGLIQDGLITDMVFSPEAGYVEIPDDAYPGDAFYGSPPVWIPYPGQFYIWTGSEFILDQGQFTPYLISQINLYRDEKTSINVSFDNGTDEYTVFNDERTRVALQQKMNRLELTPNETVNFETVGGYFDLTVLDFQGLFRVCDDRQQHCFDAAKFIKDNHATTPYTTLQEAKDDFDEAL